MKMTEIKELTQVDLEKKIKEAESNRINLKMDLLSNELKDVTKIRKNRKAIARLKTVLSERKGADSGRKK
jgi:large subunit ribosomal protein L29